MFRIFALFFFIIALPVKAIVTFEESRDASAVIGKWLSRSTGHFDFYSATPVAPKRAGERFMITVEPAKQFASDYGYSFQQIKRDQNVTNAYETLGFDTENLSDTIQLSRFHANFGITNDYDLTFSYLMSSDDISGWGVGFKSILFKYRYFFLSHRLQLGNSELVDYFKNWVLVNDLSMSLYLRLVDIYLGVRHSAGKVKFSPSNPTLDLPEVKYFSTLKELEYYYGIVLATTTNTRLTLQLNKTGDEYSIGTKFSLHFDSLLPTFNNWFRDPRYIKQ